MNGNEHDRPEAGRSSVDRVERQAPVLRATVSRRLLVIRKSFPSTGRRLRFRIERLWHSFSDSLERDLDAGHGGPWVVLAFALGIWIYFALPREPFIWATGLLALVMATVAWRRWQVGSSARLSIMCAAICAGLACADLRAGLVEAPQLTRAGGYDVTGRVVAVEGRQRGYRVALRPTSISRIDPDTLPQFVRVTARAPKQPPAVGTTVSFRARLAPPGGSVLPGGYAFDRAAYFARIGGSGFVLGAIHETSGPPPGWALWIKAGLAQTRAAISKRIRDSIEGDAGGIAAALIVGDRGGVSEDAQENLRVAGLAHVLAISGMHMALVSGTIFFALRAFLACFSTLALKYPIRHWAAAAALMAATAYLFLSGASIATQRAYIMAAIIFIAILVGRPALTMRSVAVAALAILALSPEALMQPGFQMSFTAVIALVAAYEAWSKREKRADPGEASGNPILRQMWFWISGLLMTSLIAGLATAPIAAAHFYRVSPLGLIANMAAMPLVSLVIMPAAVASVLTMPFGLAPIFLAAMAWGIEAMQLVARTVAGWTPAGGLVGTIPEAATLASLSGLLVMAFLKSRWRFLGLVPIAAGALAAPHAVRPDVIISEDGRSVAARQADGSLAILQGRGGRFSAEIWLRSDGDNAPVGERKGQSPDLRCDDQACVLRAVPPSVGGTASDAVLRIAVLKTPMALVEDCILADVIVAPFVVPEWCRRHAKVYDRARLQESGATALYLGRDTKSFRDDSGAEDINGDDATSRTNEQRFKPDTSSMRLRIETIETARSGRHRPWHGAPAD